MRVLQVLGVWVSNGGIESFVFNTISNMDMSDLHIDYLTPFPCNDVHFHDLAGQRGGRFISLNIPPEEWNAFRKNYAAFRAFLKKNRYDVVHIHSTRILTLAVMSLAARTVGVPNIIVHSHSTGQTESIKHVTMRPLASAIMSQTANTYCACSKEAADWKFSSFLSRRAIVVNNGIDVDRFSYNEERRKIYRSKFGISDSAYVIGHVGRLSSEKNQIFLVKVFERIIQQNADAYLMLVGDGNMKEDIQQLVDEKRLTGRVILTGSANNVNDYLQAMDAFVFPSVFEGFGISAIEAQATGLPVIASDTVPRSIKLTDDVVFLDLNDSMDRWADTIREFRGRPRHDNSRIVRDKGYDIKGTAAQIRRLYFM